MNTFVGQFPLAYLHHDDRINPRSIGSNIRGLIEEFVDRRPQLHVALGWWAPEGDGLGKLRVFDGQHKAAAQILLGVHELPVRVFVDPDTNVLLQANTNAGGKLRQVAFDSAVMRHLGSTLYVERVNQYRADAEPAGRRLFIFRNGLGEVLSWRTAGDGTLHRRCAAGRRDA